MAHKIDGRNGSIISWKGNLGSAQASDIGLRAGDWPTEIEVQGKASTKTFSRQGSRFTQDEDRDLISFTYRCGDLKLEIFNG